MLRLALRSIVATLFASAWCSSAQAKTGSGGSLDAPNAALSVTLGLGMPNGSVGVEGQLDPLPWISLSAGAGVSGNLQIATMGRLRLPFYSRDGIVAFTAGFGVSRGKDQWVQQDCCFDGPGWQRTFEGTVWWKNYELGVEARIERWLLKGTAGWSVAGNPQDMVCIKATPDPCDGLVPTWIHLPYLGISVGRTWR